ADARRATDPAEQARLKGELLGAGLALGLLQADPAQWFGTAAGNDGDDARIQGLIDERAAAKQARDFARSDAIRDQLAAEGMVREAPPQGVRRPRTRGCPAPPRARPAGHAPTVETAVTDSPFPLEPTAAEAQTAIAEEFGFFGDWSERYQYLIDLGRKLPPFPDELRTEAHKVTGCQSQVWLVAAGDASKLEFRAISDSAVVSGLIALLLRVYSGRSARAILDTEPRFVDAIGLAKHLSPTRSNGLAAMLHAVREYARRALA